ncbi:MAG: class I SAM-dependent methyltransferase, partial [Clostridiales Family XIII bacterium]|nr:class I SAM-dependent methyltransferase [Clostridiales Family XIII bacterium]
MMLFHWSHKKIDYYRRAGEYTGFFAKLLSLLLPLFDADDEVADLGSGLGLFDLLLAPHVRHIDAIDEHPAAIADLEAEIRERGIGNIDTTVASVENLAEHEWDVIFMSFFGLAAGDLTAMLKRARKRVIIVTHNDDKARRGKNAYSKRRLSNATAIADYIDGEGIEYQRFDYLMDFGHPLKSLEDAEHFADCDTHGSRKSAMHSELIAIKDGDYAYFVPKDKNISVFVIDT